MSELDKYTTIPKEKALSKKGVIMGEPGPVDLEVDQLVTAIPCQPDFGRLQGLYEDIFDSDSTELQYNRFELKAGIESHLQLTLGSYAKDQWQVDDCVIARLAEDGLDGQFQSLRPHLEELKGRKFEIEEDLDKLIEEFLTGLEDQQTLNRQSIKQRIKVAANSARRCQRIRRRVRWHYMNIQRGRSDRPSLLEQPGQSIRLFTHRLQRSAEPDRLLDAAYAADLNDARISDGFREHWNSRRWAEDYKLPEYVSTRVLRANEIWRLADMTSDLVYDVKRYDQGLCVLKLTPWARLHGIDLSYQGETSCEASESEADAISLRRRALQLGEDLRALMIAVMQRWRSYRKQCLEIVAKLRRFAETEKGQSKKNIDDSISKWLEKAKSALWHTEKLGLIIETSEESFRMIKHRVEDWLPDPFAQRWPLREDEYRIDDEQADDTCYVPEILVPAAETLGPDLNDLIPEINSDSDGVATIECIVPDMRVHFRLDRPTKADMESVRFEGVDPDEILENTVELDTAIQTLQRIGNQARVDVAIRLHAYADKSFKGKPGDRERYNQSLSQRRGDWLCALIDERLGDRFKVTQEALGRLKDENLPDCVIAHLACIKYRPFEPADFRPILEVVLGRFMADRWEPVIRKHALGPPFKQCMVHAYGDSRAKATGESIEDRIVDIFISPADKIPGR